MEIQVYKVPPPYLGEALEDAERLLKYAAEMGIHVGEETRDHILQARAASSVGWDQETAGDLIAALETLAAKLKPVTAGSLKACAARPTVRKYWIVSICLVVPIVLFSVASFVTSAISSTVKGNILAANELAVKLRTELGPPSQQGTGGAVAPANSTLTSGANADPIIDSTVITQLQQFASDIREIDREARQLNVFVLFKTEMDPIPANVRKNAAQLQTTFELPKDLPNFAVANSEQTYLYQRVRYFAQSLVADVGVFYGAITICLLPVLYALLGTCAYLSRTFELQVAARTFTPSVADGPRFLIAGIAGAVIGLFNNFVVGQGISIPPLAIAFLVGYAVDVFFSFLEGMLQKFTTRSAASSASPSADGS